MAGTRKTGEKQAREKQAVWRAQTKVRRKMGDKTGKRGWHEDAPGCRAFCVSTSRLHRLGAPELVHDEPPARHLDPDHLYPSSSEC